MAEPLFHSVPGKARSAFVGLLLLGMLWLAFGGVCLWMLMQDGADGFREYLTIYLLALGSGAIAAMSLLIWRKRLGRVVAWLILPFFLVFFPIGTIGGIIVIFGLHSDDMREYLH